MLHILFTLNLLYGRHLFLMRIAHANCNSNDHTNFIINIFTVTYLLKKFTVSQYQYSCNGGFLPLTTYFYMHQVNEYETTRGQILAR